MIAPRWEVAILHPVDGQPKLWDVYTELERAESIAATLRKHGIAAQITRVDDQAEEPEHRGERRAFLIWACMLGVVKPERVVERIVAEIEQESTTP